LFTICPFSDITSVPYGIHQAQVLQRVAVTTADRAMKLATAAEAILQPEHAGARSTSRV